MSSCNLCNVPYAASAMLLPCPYQGAREEGGGSNRYGVVKYLTTLTPMRCEGGARKEQQVRCLSHRWKASQSAPQQAREALHKGCNDSS